MKGHKSATNLVKFNTGNKSNLNLVNINAYTKFGQISGCALILKMLSGNKISDINQGP